MSLDPRQFLEYVIEPALVKINMSSASALALVLGTGLEESGLTYLDQLDVFDKPGPAYGLFQMEEATHHDIWDNYLRYNYPLHTIMIGMVGHSPRVTDLRTHLLYAAAMCRIHYRRAKPALPAPDDARGMAEYWKAHYNTPLGKGTVEKAIPKFQRAIQLVGEL
jgi:hypothetical protein